MRRNNQSADTARHRPTGYLVCMHARRVLSLLCAFETHVAIVSAVSRGTRRSCIALYAAEPRKQRIGDLVELEVDYDVRWMSRLKG